VETAEAFTVTAYVPGVDLASLETTVHGENLTVFGPPTWCARADWTPV